jgi:hypothetical protein
MSGESTPIARTIVHVAMRVINVVLSFAGEH